MVVVIPIQLSYFVVGFVAIVVSELLQNCSRLHFDATQISNFSFLLDKEEHECNDEETGTDEPCSPGFLTNAKSGVTVELLGQDLWKKFYRLGTEMIITKAGR